MGYLKNNVRQSFIDGVKEVFGTTEMEVITTAQVKQVVDANGMTSPAWFTKGYGTGNRGEYAFGKMLREFQAHTPKTANRKKRK